MFELGMQAMEIGFFGVIGVAIAVALAWLSTYVVSKILSILWPAPIPTIEEAIEQANQEYGDTPQIRDEFSAQLNENIELYGEEPNTKPSRPLPKVVRRKR